MTTYTQDQFDAMPSDFRDSHTYNVGSGVATYHGIDLSCTSHRYIATNKRPIVCFDTPSSTADYFDTLEDDMVIIVVLGDHTYTLSVDPCQHTLAVTGQETIVSDDYGQLFSDLYDIIKAF